MLENEEELKPPISPRFRERLQSSIMEEMAKPIAFAEPLLEAAKVAVDEAADFVAFEIQKVELQLQKAEWESIVDVEDVAKKKEWLERLRQVQQDLKTDGALSSMTFLRNLSATLESTFL